jgi:F-type H+-transporting ATPase subunit c
MKKALTSVMSFATVLFSSALAFAQEHAAGTTGSGSNSWYAASAAFAIAIAAAFGALGQSRAAAAALEGIGRNPGAAGKVQTPMIIALALIESLVIYALVIAFLLQGKIA